MRGSQRGQGARSQMVWTMVTSVLTLREMRALHKESTCNSGDAEDMASVPGSGRSPGGGPDNPLQNSCLENSMDRGAW